MGIKLVGRNKNEEVSNKKYNIERVLRFYRDEVKNAVRVERLVINTLHIIRMVFYYFPKF